MTSEKLKELAESDNKKKAVKVSNSKAKASPNLEGKKEDRPAVSEKEAKAFLKKALSEGGLHEVTPAIAQYFLDNRVDTRALRNHKIVEFSNAISEDRFISEACPAVAFTEDGMLCDGTHRFSAIVRSGKPVKLPFRTVSAAHVHVLDIGSTRTGADVLYQKYPDLGGATARLLAIAVSWVGAYEKAEEFKFARGKNLSKTPDAKKRNTRNISPKTPSTFEVGQFLDEHEGLIESVKAIEEIVPTQGALLPGGQGSALHYIITSRKLYEKKGDVDAFFKALYKGVGDFKEGGSILAMRERLQAEKGRSARLNMKGKVALVIRGWNRQTQSDITATDLVLKAGGNFPLLRKPSAPEETEE